MYKNKAFEKWYHKLEKPNTVAEYLRQRTSTQVKTSDRANSRENTKENQARKVSFALQP